MSPKLLFSMILVSLTSVGISGCAVDAQSDDEGDEVSAEEALKTSVAPGTFKLYLNADHVPNPGCDVYTQLTLSASPAKAKLSEHVGGFCKIAVVPNDRTYRLKRVPAGCGSKAYKGTFRKNGERHTILITDHRTRTCKDIVPAKIIVEETTPGETGPMTNTKYSFDRSLNECEVDDASSCGPGMTCAPGICKAFCLDGDLNCCAPNKCIADEPTFCPQDAKLCPDGSYVSRTGPNCEFAPCN